ncbi:L-ascorbate metabolism protein UlaG (beta-lactamase superfamily) [Maribacter caenipelagi]|uniref:L-ascorbate metabolism protein UlaG (Beta-lactamase superfamily) n=1 Tax=Maribacter caenipelagi TaxID=1447781 RepID=A0A4R7CYI4_9FLAO|nr:MBL fold metallo-hydrolase [Maribacter caenipelagi]TDS13663.1 L-ascorbate metabolism protein UlaG (beta-lactamase superfamily) [Maribacter caenipelagi]
MITTLIIIGLLAIFVLALTNLYPSFGGNSSESQKLTYEQSQQFREGKFRNVEAVPKDLELSGKLGLAYKFFTTKVPNGRPKADLIPQKIDSIHLADYDGVARMIWFGHSSFLLQIDGKNILIDPMFGAVAAPHPLLGEKRFNKEFPISIDKLPQIDAVIFSHDHYDHLDYESVLKIKDKTNHFYTPLGVGNHLTKWGVSDANITEMDWWQETQFGSLKFVCTPAQHFSGRGLNNAQSTLWSSWVITSENENIFFSGDSGYASHFTEIGEKYGPFDLALMECGQYNEMWSDIHMMPEETAQAGIDVKAKKIMPIHWAGFKLALHEWTDPIKRVEAKAVELNIEVISPQIGQEIIVKDSVNNYSDWWKSL